MIKNKIYWREKYLWIDGFLYGWIIGIVLVLGFVYFYFNYVPIATENTFSENGTDYNQLVEICNKTDIFKSSECLHNFVKENFVYNLSNQNKMDLNFEKLMVEGGVCWQFSELFCGISKSYGYNTQLVDMVSYSYYHSVYQKDKLTEREKIDSLHEVCLISNAEGYCILDQQSIFCNKFERENYQ